MAIVFLNPVKNQPICFQSAFFGINVEVMFGLAKVIVMLKEDNLLFPPFLLLERSSAGSFCIVKLMLSG